MAPKESAERKKKKKCSTGLRVAHHLHRTQSSDRCSWSSIDLCGFKVVICENGQNLKVASKLYGGSISIYCWSLLLSPPLAVASHLSRSSGAAVHLTETEHSLWDQQFEDTTEVIYGNFDQDQESGYETTWLAATGETRGGRGAESKKKEPRRIWIYSNCISHVYLVTTLWIEMIHSWIMRIDLGIKKVIVGSDFTVHRQCHRSGVVLMDDRPPQCCTTTGVGERSQSQWNDSAALQELHIILTSLY